MATTTQNGQNIKGPKCNNKSTGLLGAYTFKEYFVSFIRTNGKKKHLGYFKTAEEAHAAYIKAKRELHEFNTL